MFLDRSNGRAQWSYPGRMHASNLEAQIAEIQVALLERCDRLGVMVADTVWREVDFYSNSRMISRDELIESCVENLRFIFQGLDAPAAFDTSAAVRTGTARALAGTPLATVMEAYRIGCRLIWEEIVNEAAKRPHVSREVLIRATARIWMAQDVFTHAMAQAYREETTRKVLAQAAERAALVEALFEGGLGDQSNVWEVAAALRLPGHGPYVVVAAECPALGKAALPGIEAKLASLDISSAWRLLPDVQLGLVHVRSDSRFNTLKQTLTRAAATRIGISSRFDDLDKTPDGVTYARTALAAKRNDGSFVGVFDAEPLTIAAVSAPPRVMKQIATGILAGFADLDEDERDVLFATFREWISAGGSLDETAQHMFCHPNTVRNRLHRIEERTGKSLGRPLDLAELCLAFEIDRRLP